MCTPAYSCECLFSVENSARTSSQRLKIGLLNRLRSCFSRQCVKSRTSYLLYAGTFALIRCVSVLVHLSDDPLFTCLYLHMCVRIWGCDQAALSDGVCSSLNSTVCQKVFHIGNPLKTIRTCQRAPVWGPDRSPAETEEQTFSAPKSSQTHSAECVLLRFDLKAKV